MLRSVSVWIPAMIHHDRVAGYALNSLRTCREVALLAARQVLDLKPVLADPVTGGIEVSNLENYPLLGGRRVLDRSGHEDSITFAMESLTGDPDRLGI